MVEPLAPERLMLKEEYLQSRLISIDEFANNLWPELTDKFAPVSWHYLRELEHAINILKQRKRVFLKNHPKKKRGGQGKWGESELKLLLLRYESFKTDCKTRKVTIEKLSELYGIGFKKIEERLKLAHESVKI